VSLRARERAARQAPENTYAGDRSGRPKRGADLLVRVVPIVAVVALLGAAVLANLPTRAVTAPVPETESILSKVDCTGRARCVSVGSTGSRYTIRSPYVLRLGGDAWVNVSPDSPLDNGDSFLSAVACPTLARCIAVGRQDVPAPYFGAKSGGSRPLIETWTGHAWHTQQIQIPPATTEGELTGVDCAGSTCVAVGSFSNKTQTDRVLTEVWNGSSWKLVVPPKPRQMEDPSLNAVACSSATSCTAVGHFSYEVGFSSLTLPLVLGWNGREWRFERSGPVGNSLDTELGSIACPSTQTCIAVGLERPAGGRSSTFAEIRDPRGWHVLKTPELANTQYSVLVDVSCWHVDRCIAVGYAVRGGNPEPLVESWNGSRWTVEPAPSVADTEATALSGIWCGSATSCHAVGNYRNESPIEHPFTTVWDGTTWTTTTLASP